MIKSANSTKINPARWFRQNKMMSSLVLVTLSILCELSLYPVKVSLSPDELFDQDFDTTSDLERLKTEFNIYEGLQLIFVKKSPNALDTKEACFIQDWISEISLKEESLSAVQSAFQLRELEMKKDKSGNNILAFPRLLQPNCDLPESNFSLESVLDSPWKGAAINSNGSDMIVDLSFHEETPHSKILALIHDIQVRTLKQTQDLQLYIGGKIAFILAMKGALLYTLVLNLFGILLLSAIIRFFFGRWKGCVALTFSLFITFLVVLALMSIFSVPIDMVNSSLFLIAVIATIEDFVFIFFLQSQGASFSESIDRLKKPSFLTSFTTWLGFTSLIVSDLALIRRFGIIAGATAMIEWVVIFQVLPRIVELYPHLGEWATPQQNLGAQKLVNWLSNYTPSRLLTFILLIFIPFSLYAAKNVVVSETPSLIFSEDHPLTHTSRYYAETRKSYASGELVMNSSLSEPEMKAIYQKFKSMPTVGRIEDPFAMESFIIRKLPVEEQIQFLSTLRSTPDFSPWRSSSGSVKAHFDIADENIETIEALRKNVKEICPNHECFVAGSFVSYAEFGDKVRHTLLESMLLSLGLVTLFLAGLAVYQKQAAAIPALTIGLLWGPALCIVFIAWLKLPIGLMSCLFAAVLAGVTGDNAIQFLMNNPKRTSLKETMSHFGSASIIQSIMMICVTSVFILSPFRMANTLGILLVIGFLASLFGDLWIVKGLLGKKGAHEI